MRKRTVSTVACMAGLIAFCNLVSGGCRSSKKKGEREKSGRESADKTAPAGEESDSSGSIASEFKSVNELQAMVDEIKIPDLPGGTDLFTIAYVSAGQGELFAAG